MMHRVFVCAFTTFVLIGGGIFNQTAAAQTQYLLNDRNNDRIHRLHDLNGDGQIVDPSEVSIYFAAGNLAGTIGPMNPTALAVSKCRVAAMGDQGHRIVYLLRDLNNDGDAMDVEESIVYQDAQSTTGIGFASPSGSAFDSHCVLYVVNAGNALGPDAIYRLQDLNGDGDAKDRNETDFYVGPPFFGFGNNPNFSPQEIFFDDNDVLYMRNSGSGNANAVWRFEDLNKNNRADDAGEATLFVDPTNLSGVPLSAGLVLEPDRLRMSQHLAMYTLQLATGGIDQLVRLIDPNGDGDAMDAGEVALVWVNPEAGFASADVVSLANGDVLVTDNSGIRVFLLRDLNNDDDFHDADESSVYFTGQVGAGGVVAQARQLDIYCGAGDVNCDGIVNVDDLLGLLQAWANTDGCIRTDINCDGNVNVDDLLSLLQNWG